VGKSKTKVQKKGKKASSTSSSKILSCSFCNLTFYNRFKYSNHCGSPAHKAKVFGMSQASVEQSVVDVAVKDNKTDKEDTNTTNDVSRFAGEGNLEQDKSTDLASGNLPEEKIEQDNDKELNEDADDSDENNENQDNIDDKTDTESDNSGPEDAEVENTGEAADENKTDEMNNSEQPEDSTPLLTLHICTVCDKKYPNKYMVSKHLLTKYHKNRAAARPKAHFEMLQKYNNCIVKFSPYQCGICRFYYNSYEDFKMHVTSDHHANACKGLTGEIQCSLCKFKSHDLVAVLNHFDSEQHVTAVATVNKICILKECHVKSTCKYCGLEMRSFNRLMRHVKLKHSDGIKVLGVAKRVKGLRHCPVCPNCLKQCVSESALRRHILRHHSSERQHRCDPCNKSFVDKYTLTRHIKSEAHVALLKAKSEKDEYVEDVEGNAEQTNKSEDIIEKTVDKEKVECKSDIQSKTAGNQDSDNVNNKDDNDTNMFLSAVTGVIIDKSIQVEDESDDEGQMKEDIDDEYEPPKKKRQKHLRVKPFVKISGKKVKKKTFKCDHCDFTVSRYDDLRPHYMDQHSAQIRTCEPCDMTFLSEKAYKLHWNSSNHQKNIGATKVDDDVKLYECHVCKKKYADENYKNFHTAYQHLHATTESAAVKENGGKSITYEKYSELLKSVEPFHFGHQVTCPDCGTVIKKANLMCHLRTHTEERLFKCKICSKDFIASYTLRKHLLQHFGCTDRTCDICGKDFKKVSAFQKHMKIHREEQSSNGKTFICETCGMDFYLESQLKRHVTRHMEKKFKCPFPDCHWKFVQKGELNAHYKCHEVEKKYLCDTCGYAAHTPYHLKRHYKVHTGERKFQCEYCTYRAGNRTHLQRHMRIHIGSKPFKCPYCSYSCNTHENIRKHILETKKHQGKNMYPCKFCPFGTNSSRDFRFHLEAEHEDLIGKDFREPALTAFTGVYNRNLDPRQPEEGMKIIPLKERKQSRRKKGDMDDSLNELDSMLKLERASPNKRKGRKSEKRGGFDISIPVSLQQDFLAMESATMNVPSDMQEDKHTLVPYDNQALPLSLIVNKNTKSFAPICTIFPSNRTIRPESEGAQQFVQSQVPDMSMLYPEQQGVYYNQDEAGGLERYVTVEGKPTGTVMMPFNN